MRLATKPFWLDGGYDRESVEACPYHPQHRWWRFRLGDVLANATYPDERLTICRGCYAPRCGEGDDLVSTCDLPRHHREDHCTPGGASWPIGGSR